MTKIKLTRQAFLNSIFVFGIIPQDWILHFKDVYKIDEEIDRVNIRTFYNLKQEKFIEVKKENGKKFVSINHKGYEKIPHHIQVQIPFIKNQRIPQKIDTNHNKITFYFLLEVMAIYGIDKIATATTKKAFKITKHKNELKPDVALRFNGSKYNSFYCLESDTGTENNLDIFDKLLRYFHFAKSNFDGEDVESLEVFFLVQSKERQKALFEFLPNQKQRHYLKYFDDEILKFKTDKRNKETINTSEVLDILESGKVKFHCGIFGEGLDSFTQVKLKELIRLSRAIGKTPEMERQENRKHQRTQPTEEQKRRLAIDIFAE